jgi:hypothetical protein
MKAWNKRTSLRVRQEGTASWLTDQLSDSATSLGYEKSVNLILITVHYWRHSPGREKKETRTEFLV